MEQKNYTLDCKWVGAVNNNQARVREIIYAEYIHT